MQETVELAADGFDDARSAVAGVKASDAAGEVDHAVAIDIFDCRAFSFRNENGCGMKDRLRDCRVTTGHQRLGARAGNLSTKLDSGHVSLS